MKQILQDLKNGETLIEEVPVPRVKSGCSLIRTNCSLISAGTERMLLDFGRAGWLDKARQQPDKVKQVVEKIKTDGLLPTVEAVQSKLDQAIPLGYCNVGRIVESQLRKGEKAFPAGTRVVSNGYHAEYVVVPHNLCAPIPENVNDEAACFTVVGAIAMQGTRLAKPTIGECFVVTGLGLVGLLTVQILIANGCRVLGIDLDSAKCALARQFGALSVDLSKGEDPVSVAQSFSRGCGVDGVLITAATKSNVPVHQAALMCRKKGRIILVGVTGLQLQRDDFFKKELSFQVSCSYGPGRYDSTYEQQGHDYPLPYVRWTEQRNMEAVLDLMATGKLDVTPFITHRFPLKNASAAYKLIVEEKEPYIGILLQFLGKVNNVQKELPRDKIERTILLYNSEINRTQSRETPTIGFIGAGDFSGKILLPALKNTGCKLKTIVSSGGVSSTRLGKKFGFEKSSTEVDSLFNDPEIDTIFITTRHSTHAQFIIKALQSGKNVFTEKPLCLTFKELGAIEKAYSTAWSEKSAPHLFVGFNRRFAPHVVRMKELITSHKEPKAIIITVNAGSIPPDHWVHDPTEGGGRVIGELCHFIDLAVFFAGSHLLTCNGAKMISATNDTLSVQMEFKDGSIANINYFANGNKAYPKEKIEVFCGGKILYLDNFRKLTGHGWKDFKKMSLFHQNKGHHEEVKQFISAIRHAQPSPISFEEIIQVSKQALELDSI